MKRHRELCDVSEELTKKIQAVAAVACISLPSDAFGLLDSLAKRIEEQARRSVATNTAEYILAEAALHQEGFNQLAVFAR